MQSTHVALRELTAALRTIRESIPLSDHLSSPAPPRARFHGRRPCIARRRCASLARRREPRASPNGSSGRPRRSCAGRGIAAVRSPWQPPDWSAFGVVVCLLVTRFRVLRDNQIAAECDVHVVHALDVETTYVEAVHERRRRRFDDADQHVPGTPAVQSGGAIIVARTGRDGAAQTRRTRMRFAAGEANDLPTIAGLTPRLNGRPPDL